MKFPIVLSMQLLGVNWDAQSWRTAYLMSRYCRWTIRKPFISKMEWKKGTNWAIKQCPCIDTAREYQHKKQFRKLKHYLYFFFIKAKYANATSIRNLFLHFSHDFNFSKQKTPCFVPSYLSFAYAKHFKDGSKWNYIVN